MAYVICDPSSLSGFYSLFILSSFCKISLCLRQKGEGGIDVVETALMAVYDIKM